MRKWVAKNIRAALVGVGLVIGSGLAAAALIPPYSGPAGSNPTPDYPPGLATFNALINQINGAISSINFGLNAPAGAPRNVLQSADFGKNGYSTGVTVTVSGTLSASYIGAPNLWASYGLSIDPTFSVAKSTAAQPTGQAASSKIQRTAAQTATGFIGQIQEIPTKMITKYAGQPMFCSFNAIADANFSAANSAATWNFVTGTGTDQGLNVASTGTASLAGTNWLGWTGAVATGTGLQAITTTWARYVTPTFFLPSAATEAFFSIGFVPVGTAGTTDAMEVGDVQCESGVSPSVLGGATTATVFERESLDQIQEDEQYQVVCPIQENGTPLLIEATGVVTSTTVAQIEIPLPVIMRSTPVSMTSAVGSLALTVGSTPISMTAFGVPKFSNLGVTIAPVVSAGLSPVNPTQIATGPLATGQFCVGTPF